MKKCTKCGKSKNLDDFYRNKSKRDGRSSHCKSCLKAGRKISYRKTGSTGVQWKKDNPKRAAELERNYRNKKKYGLTPEQYLKLIANGCEVCGSHERLCVDHDHSCCPAQVTCGKCVRGVLCVDCNIAEGRLKSRPELARSLAKYMEKREGTQR